jgi:hypothetical protein
MKYCENAVVILAVVFLVVIIVNVDDFAWPTEVNISGSYEQDSW